MCDELLKAFLDEFLQI